MYRLAGYVCPCLMAEMRCVRELKGGMGVAESVEGVEGITVSGPVVAAVEVDVGC